jgi:hypothetical protein
MYFHGSSNLMTRASGPICFHSTSQPDPFLTTSPNSMTSTPQPSWLSSQPLVNKLYNPFERQYNPMYDLDQEGTFR